MDRSLFAFSMNRDGEMISLCRYSPCMGKECECKNSSKILNSGSKPALVSAVSLQLRRGFYHDRYNDITKVPLSTSLGAKQ